VEVPTAGKAMVVEFWASWCGPCRMAFPHLSQLARKYKAQGLVVIGVNIEGDPTAAKRTVMQQGNQMDYLVAMDAGQQASMRLMAAAGMSGIPCAFVIDAKGIIRHYGHPMEPKFSQVVDQVCKESSSAAAGVPSQDAGEPMAQARPKVTQTREELLTRPVRELKDLLAAWQVDYRDVNEKGELVDRIIERCTGS
jgi:thiol-disulfide isomerase/thioredoxin